MARSDTRGLVGIGARALAMLMLVSAPALADDAARISFLESEIQRLRSQVNEQNRRIQRLEAELERIAGGAEPTSVTIGHTETMLATPASAPQRWHAPAAWDRIEKGMSLEQVRDILGEPTAIESIEALKTLFYRGATVEGRSLSGHVNFKDDRVVAVRKPAAEG